MTRTYDLPDGETGTPADAAEGTVTVVEPEQPGSTTPGGPVPFGGDGGCRSVEDVAAPALNGPSEAVAEPEAALVPAVPERRRALVPGTDIPIIPGADEMRGMAALAVTLAGADAVPTALRGKPNDVFQVLLTARDLGVATTTAMREFHVIDGKVTLSPKVKLAMVNERGRQEGWAVWPGDDNDAEHATWYATRADRRRPDGSLILFTSVFTIGEAQGIKIGTKRNSTEALYLADKDNWRGYPKRMLSWRALGYLLDDVFPEVGTGLYSPDEMGAMTDEDGVPVIDVASTEPLPGTSAPRGHRGSAPPAESADPLDAPLAEGLPEVHAAFTARLTRIKTVESAHADLSTRWQGSNLVPFRHATVRNRARIEALITAAEKAMTDGAYGAEGQRAMATPADAPPPPDAPAPIPDGGHPPVAPAPPPAGVWRDHEPGCGLSPDHAGACDASPPAERLAAEADAAVADRSARLARATQIASEAGLDPPGTLPQPAAPEARSVDESAPSPDPEPGGGLDPGALDALWVACTEAVAAMEGPVLIKNLRDRGLTIMGGEADKRARLINALVAEAAGR